MNNKDFELFNSSKLKNKPFFNKGPNSKILREYKMSLNNLSEEQKEASIGLMLGDASLQTQNKGKTHRMKFEWGNINKSYLEHVYSLFDEWVISPPHMKSRINKNGNTIVNWGFQTISHQAFNFLKDLFLIKKHKSITVNLINDYLTARGLAYWFMDDGGKWDYNKTSQNKSVVLNTHSFSKEEVEIMNNELSNKFKLDTNIRINKNKFIIVINHECYDKFLNIVDPYFISSMRYKLPK